MRVDKSTAGHPSVCSLPAQFFPGVGAAGSGKQPQPAVNGRLRRIRRQEGRHRVRRLCLRIKSKQQHKHECKKDDIKCFHGIGSKKINSQNYLISIICRISVCPPAVSR